MTFTRPKQLGEADDLTGFCSGVDLVDEWLVRRARKARSAGTAVTYVSCADGRVAGFYSLSSQSMTRGETSGWLARNVPEQIPVVLLGMLGVDRAYQGMGLGADLLADAAQRASNVAQVIGARALVVDPYDESSRGFYGRWGFRPVPGSTRMFAKLV